MSQGMLDAVKMAQLAFDQDNKKDDYVLTGETNLMGFSELSDMDRLKSLFEAFSQKQGVIHLLDQCMKADGVQIFIGEESGYRAFDHCPNTSVTRKSGSYGGDLGRLAAQIEYVADWMSRLTVPERTYFDYRTMADLADANEATTITDES